MSTIMVTLLAVFFGTAALCAAFGLLVIGKREDPLRRLEWLNPRFMPSKENSRILKKELLAESAAGLAELWQRIGISPVAIRAWYRQAELPIPGWLLLAIAGLMSVGLVAAAKRLHTPTFVYPIVALAGAAVPLGYVVWRRKKLINRFSEQLPDALEMMASSLRTGNTIQLSMQVVAAELMPPVSQEFGTVSESIRLGIPVEQALDEMASRVPNEDLDFFVTAVVMQRQCGGDLSEILDKISYLVRERFYIQGQVQALTGEGRMSGAVLIALPILVFCALYVLNRDYVMLLFNEPLGKKMLAAGIVLQLLGAVAIRRIINIQI
jgi:tight adherence protein B